MSPSSIGSHDSHHDPFTDKQSLYYKSHHEHESMFSDKKSSFSVGAAAPMASVPLPTSAKNKKAMLLGGIALVVLGIIFAIVGLLMLLSGFTSFGNAAFGNVQNPGNMVNPLGGMGSFFGGFGVLILGFVLVFIGGALIYFSQLRRVTSYVANEVSPAVTTMTHAASQGIASGLKDGGGITLNVNSAQTTSPAQTIKVKCRSCGYLESEDAMFCSKCGNRM